MYTKIFIYIICIPVFLITINSMFPRNTTVSTVVLKTHTWYSGSSESLIRTINMITHLVPTYDYLLFIPYFYFSFFSPDYFFVSPACSLANNVYAVPVVSRVS